MAHASPPLSMLAFRLPKAGNSVEEYEDASAGEPATGRFAVADGASESSFANIWARLLVGAYVEVPGAWKKWLPAARASWLQQCMHFELPWYGQAKFEEGALATLLGVSFAGDMWKAQAVGDCCLFHVRGDNLRRKFPVRAAHEFGNQPVLLCSRRGSGHTPRLRCQGDWQQGDELFLMTDALGHWFLTQREQRRQPWRELRELDSNDDFATWIANLRTKQQMRNDDVTLLRISGRP